MNAEANIGDIQKLIGHIVEKRVYDELVDLKDFQLQLRLLLNTCKAFGSVFAKQLTRQ